MIHYAVAAEYKGGYKIEVTFDDGKSGVVDFSDYPALGGVFESFRDLDFFRSFKVSQEAGTLVWGDEIDIAPETLYSEATGSPLPEWMEADEEASVPPSR